MVLFYDMCCDTTENDDAFSGLNKDIKFKARDKLYIGAAVTQHHYLSVLNNRNLLCHSSGGWKSKL